MLDTSRLQNMFELLGCEEPLGVFYAEKAPTDCLTPPPDRGHACIINYLRMAFDRKTCVHFAADACTCMGGWVYLGYRLPAPERIVYFVTTGWEGGEGERYLPSPDSMRRFLRDIDVQLAPAPFCAARPLSQFAEGEEPLLVTFRCRGETLTGLSMLAGFALDDHNAVVMPFGSGCANIFAWPLHYRRMGRKKAVVGGSDPSCRPFMGVDELSFTVTADVLSAMQEAFPRSFLTGRTWTGVRKKIDRSRKVWEEAASR